MLYGCRIAAVSQHVHTLNTVISNRLNKETWPTTSLPEEMNQTRELNLTTGNCPPIMSPYLVLAAVVATPFQTRPMTLARVSLVAFVQHTTQWHIDHLATHHYRIIGPYQQQTYTVTLARKTSLPVLHKHQVVIPQDIVDYNRLQEGRAYPPQQYPWVHLASCLPHSMMSWIRSQTTVCWLQQQGQLRATMKWNWSRKEHHNTLWKSLEGPVFLRDLRVPAAWNQWTVKQQR